MVALSAWVKRGVNVAGTFAKVSSCSGVSLRRVLNVLDVDFDVNFDVDFDVLLCKNGVEAAGINAVVVLITGSSRPMCRMNAIIPSNDVERKHMIMLLLLFIILCTCSYYQ